MSEKLINYIRLIKFRYHITFILVVMGALLFSHQSFLIVAINLVLAYLFFNVLLYGGLYTLNDIADIESDRMHPQKKYRPLPLKKISIQSAYIFAFTTILISLVFSYFYFGIPVFLTFILFIAVNVLYTRIAKKIPYVEILFNSLTYPMRFFLGVLLVSSQTPYFLFLVIFLFAFGFACGRRIIEKKEPGWQARRVLQYYTGIELTIFQILAFIFIIWIPIIDYPFYTVWYGIAIVAYVVFIFGIYFSNSLVNFYKWLVLN